MTTKKKTLKIKEEEDTLFPVRGNETLDRWVREKYGENADWSFPLGYGIDGEEVGGEGMEVIDSLPNFAVSDDFGNIKRGILIIEPIKGVWNEDREQMDDDNMERGRIWQCDRCDIFVQWEEDCYHCNLDAAKSELEIANRNVAYLTSRIEELTKNSHK